MPFQKGNKLQVSRKGRPNRVKKDLSEAIAKFMDSNTPSMQRCFDEVLGGLREPPNPDGTLGKWILKPDPGRAFEMLRSLLEFQVPKLTRAEIVREDKPLGRVIDSSQLTPEQRQQLREFILALELEPALLEAQEPSVVEPIPVRAGLSAADIHQEATRRTE